MLTTLFNALYAVVLKNLTGWMTKKNAGSWDWRRAIPDVIFGAVAVVIGWGANAAFGIQMPEDAVLATPIYMLLTHQIDRWWKALCMKFNWFGADEGTKGKFKFFG